MKIYGMFTSTLCPDGWTPESGWDGLFLRGYNGFDENTVRGSAGHLHSVTLTGKIGGSAQQWSNFTIVNPGVRIHSAQVSSHGITHNPTNSHSTDHTPPYVNVLYCYKELDV